MSPEKFVQGTLEAPAPERAMALAKGFAYGSAELPKAVGMITAQGGRLFDWFEEKATGKPTTWREDALYRDMVDPWVARQQALLPTGDAASQVTWSVGNVVSLINQAFLGTGTAPTVSATSQVLTRMTPAAAVRPLEAVRQAALEGLGASKIPAVEAAMSTGMEVMKETNDPAKAAEAAVKEYYNTTLTLMAPAGARGTLPVRAAGGAGAGVAMGEASRIARQGYTPESMHQPFTVEGLALEAVLGAGFGAMLGKDPWAATAAFAKRMKEAPEAFQEVMHEDLKAAKTIIEMVRQVDPKKAEELQTIYDKFRDQPEEAIKRIGEAAAKKKVARKGKGKAPEEPAQTAKEKLDTFVKPPEAAPKGEEPAPEEGLYPPLPQEVYPTEHLSLIRAASDAAERGDIEAASIKVRELNDRLDVGELRGRETPQAATPKLAETIRSLSALPKSTYRVIVADPPWKYRSGYKEASGIRSVRPEAHYPVMATRDIEKLPVGQLAAEDSALIMWTTDAHLPDALRLMKSWGFEYRTVAFVWSKKTAKGGQAVLLAPWTLKSTEFALLGVKGSPKKASATVRSLVEATRGRHSQKPEEVMQRIEQLFGDVPRLELFARQQREGWQTWGNEIPHEAISEGMSEATKELSGGAVVEGPVREHIQYPPDSNPLTTVWNNAGLNVQKYFDAAKPTSSDGRTEIRARSFYEGVYRELAPHSLVARILAPMLKYIDPNLRVYVHGEESWRDNLNTRAVGAYRYKEGTTGQDSIHLRFPSEASPSFVMETVVHELVHAATVHYMVAHPNSPLTRKMESLLAVSRDLIPRTIHALHIVEGEVPGYDPARRRDPDYWTDQRGTLYGLSNAFELMATARTHGGLAELLLKAARLDRTGVVDRLITVTKEVVDTIRRMFGLGDREARLLNSIWETTEDIMAAQQTWIKGIQKGGVAKYTPSMLLGESLSGPRMQAKAAFDTGLGLARKVPEVAHAEGKLRGYWQQVQGVFSPESMGKYARQAGSIIAKAVATEAQRTSIIFGKSQERFRFWQDNPDLHMKFLADYEKGKAFVDPVLQKAADMYRAWNARLFALERAYGLKYEPVDNYIYHVFKDKVGVQNYFVAKYGRKWGDPGFVKDRTFSLYEEAIAAGYEPRYTNPEEIMLARQHAHDSAVMKIEALDEMKGAGLAVEAKGKYKKNPPKDFPASAVTRRSPNGKVYWIHKEAEAVLHNAFDTKSLWNAPGFGGEAFRATMYLKNAIVPLKLGLSAFHALHVVTIDNATGMVRASKALLAGEMGLGQWLSQMGKASLYKGFISNPRSGHRILQVVRGNIPEHALTATDRAALVAMSEGGFIPQMSHQYLTNARKSIREAFKRAIGPADQTQAVGRQAVERGKAAAKTTFLVPFAIIDKLQSYMFEAWIPSLKIASYLADCKTATLTDRTLLADPLRRQMAFRKISKSVDNRYGEMAYNTLFWNRWVKDLGVAGTLSLGWNLGFLREYGGAGIEMGQAALREGKFAEKVSRGELDRAMFVTFYTLQSLAYGGLMTYMLSGKPPEDWLDYVYPKDGELNPDGSEKRVSTMFYAREFAAIVKHGETEGWLTGIGHIALNKMSPVLGLARDMWEGTDYFGAEIFDPNAPEMEKLQQRLAYLFQESLPISVSQILEAKTETPVKTGVMSVLGFSKAPKYATETATQGRIKQTFMEYYGQPKRPYEKVEYSREVGELKDLYYAKETGEYSRRLREVADKYELAPEERRRLHTLIRKREDPYEKMFSRLTWQQQKRLLDKMTPEERKQFLPHSNKYHLRRKYRPPEEEEG